MKKDQIRRHTTGNNTYIYSYVIERMALKKKTGEDGVNSTSKRIINSDSRFIWGRDRRKKNGRRERINKNERYRKEEGGTR